jgi:hypothetical protein
VPRDHQVIEKKMQTQVHPSTAGPNPIAQKCKKNSSNTHLRHCRYRQCLGALSSLKKNCKHKSIHQLLGLIQWLKNEEKKLKKMKPQGTAGTSSVWVVKFIEKELQKQVHPSAAGPNPVAKKCKKKLK